MQHLQMPTLKTCIIALEFVFLKIPALPIIERARTQTITQSTLQSRDFPKKYFGPPSEVMFSIPCALDTEERAAG